MNNAGVPIQQTMQLPRAAAPAQSYVYIYPRQEYRKSKLLTIVFTEILQIILILQHVVNHLLQDQLTKDRVRLKIIL